MLVVSLEGRATAGRATSRACSDCQPPVPARDGSYGMMGPGRPYDGPARFGAAREVRAMAAEADADVACDVLVAFPRSAGQLSQLDEAS